MEGKVYCFNLEHALKYGLEEAIMIQGIVDCIKNCSAENCQQNEKKWITIKTLLQIFPFWTKKQIRRIINSLIEQDVLIAKNYGATVFDRTLCYEFKEEEKFFSKNKQT